MSVNQAQACINSAEFSEWQAFNSIKPFTIDRSERMLSIICSILANSGKSKQDKSYKPEDFLIMSNQKKPVNAAEIEKKIKVMFRGNN